MSTKKPVSIITFQCKYCGIVVRVLIRSDSSFTFSYIGNLHSEKESLTENRYFKCVHCKKIDNTKRFEKVYN